MSQKNTIQIIILFQLCIIFSCQSIPEIKDEIKAPDIFELANTTLYKDLGYQEIINIFESESLEKVYIHKKLKLDSSYLNKIVLINIKPKHKIVKHLEWEELTLGKDCNPKSFSKLINTKNELTGEDVIVCKKKDKVLMTNQLSFQNKINALDNLVRNANSNNLKDSKAKNRSDIDTIWDVFIISKRGTSRYYRVDNIDKNIKNVIEGILR